MFPGPTHLMNASLLTLLQLKYCIFFFLSHAGFAMCYLDLCYPNLDNCTTLYPHQKRTGKISKITMRAVHRWECAVLMSGWKIAGQD